MAKPPTPPAARTLGQTEAAMAQKNPPAINPAEARSLTNADGSPKSPQMREADKIAGNVDAKGERFADALHRDGFTVEDINNMKPGDLEIITEGLKAKGLLSDKESAPNTSIPVIISKLKQLERARPISAGPMSKPKARAAAEALKAEMELNQ
jgi:hypothetical protein